MRLFYIMFSKIKHHFNAIAKYDKRISRVRPWLADRHISAWLPFFFFFTVAGGGWYR